MASSVHFVTPCGMQTPELETTELMLKCCFCFGRTLVRSTNISAWKIKLNELTQLSCDNTENPISKNTFRIQYQTFLCYDGQWLCCALLLCVQVLTCGQWGCRQLRGGWSSKPGTDSWSDTSCLSSNLPLAAGPLGLCKTRETKPRSERGWE